MTAAILSLSILVAERVAPDGWRLAEALESASVRSHVPSLALEDVARRLWLRVVGGNDALAARFVPRLGDSAADWPRPRLELARRHFAPGFRDPALENWALEDLPIDSASALYGALVEAALREVAPAPWTDAARARAAKTMVDVPDDQRLDTFVEAGVAFLAHALTVAHEVARHEHRRRARGATLCGHFSVRASLFGLWQEGIFGSGRYTGFYRNAEGGWVESRSILSVEDRRWWVRSFLGVAWHGDPAKDFAWVCEARE